MPLPNAQLGAETALAHPDLVNLHGCSVGDGTKVGPSSRSRRTAMSAYAAGSPPTTSSAEGELFSRACTPEGGLKTEADWSVMPTRIRHGAWIGSNATIN
jgi:UDP-2-acetamido-3-amino-2,3-dideoxy-glucuronate N-acetyltransferase